MINNKIFTYTGTLIALAGAAGMIWGYVDRNVDFVEYSSLFGGIGLALACTTHTQKQNHDIQMQRIDDLEKRLSKDVEKFEE